ncbi:MAG: hypothetical protein RL189_2506 [Pseudomonadota bacterium]|jgi:hypothetical protein
MSRRRPVEDTVVDFQVSGECEVLRKLLTTAVTMSNDAKVCMNGLKISRSAFEAQGFQVKNDLLLPWWVFKSESEKVKLIPRALIDEWIERDPSSHLTYVPQRMHVDFFSIVQKNFMHAVDTRVFYSEGDQLIKADVEIVRRLQNLRLDEMPGYWSLIFDSFGFSDNLCSIDRVTQWGHLEEETADQHGYGRMQRRRIEYNRNRFYQKVEALSLLGAEPSDENGFKELLLVSHPDNPLFEIRQALDGIFSHRPLFFGKPVFETSIGLTTHQISRSLGRIASFCSSASLAQLHSLFNGFFVHGPTESGNPGQTLQSFHLNANRLQKILLKIMWSNPIFLLLSARLIDFSSIEGNLIAHLSSESFRDNLMLRMFPLPYGLLGDSANQSLTEEEVDSGKSDDDSQSLTSTSKKHSGNDWGMNQAKALWSQALAKI